MIAGEVVSKDMIWFQIVSDKLVAKPFDERFGAGDVDVLFWLYY